MHLCTSGALPINNSHQNPVPLDNTILENDKLYAELTLAVHRVGQGGIISTILHDTQLTITMLFYGMDA